MHNDIQGHQFYANKISLVQTLRQGHSQAFIKLYLGQHTLTSTLQLVTSNFFDFVLYIEFQAYYVQNKTKPAEVTNCRSKFPTISRNYQLQVEDTNYRSQSPTIGQSYQLQVEDTNYRSKLPIIGRRYQLQVEVSNYRSKLPTIGRIVTNYRSKLPTIG